MFLIGFPQSSHGNWWYLGLSSSQYQSTNGSSSSSSTAVLCSETDVFEEHQREMCSKARNVVGIVSRGAAAAIDECQFQFKDSRWNCTTFHDQKTVFGKVLSVNSRETAFVYAVLSAGVTHAVAKACAKGELKACSCDVTVRSPPKDGRFAWGGCSHDVTFAERFSREFVETTREDENKKNISVQRRIINRWNGQAGRKAVTGSMRLLCKCHGVSGSCSAKICWRTVAYFRDIGHRLKDRFDAAVRVKVTSRRSKVRPVDVKQKRPKKRDLVYLDQSPDYCNALPEVGSVGTSGRQCSQSSYGLDGCQLLCCGRGYRTYVEEVTDDCDCKFIWCCHVECRKCVTQVERQYCN